jgi:selT/selW/selH-like putative selenoprotein
VSLADEITAKLGLEATALPGSKGQFDVFTDGTLLFSKKTEGRFPEESEILGQLGS